MLAAVTDFALHTVIRKECVHVRDKDVLTNIVLVWRAYIRSYWDAVAERTREHHQSGSEYIHWIRLGWLNFCWAIRLEYNFIICACICISKCLPAEEKEKAILIVPDGDANISLWLCGKRIHERPMVGNSNRTPPATLHFYRSLCYVQATMTTITIKQRNS